MYIRKLKSDITYRGEALILGKRAFILPNLHQGKINYEFL